MQSSSLLMLMVVVTAVLTCSQVAAQRKLVCYYGNWAMYTTCDGKLHPAYIDANLCTHAMYAFIDVHPNGTVKFIDEYADIALGGIASFNNLKTINKNLKTLISLGGGTSDSAVFSGIAASATKRANLVTSAFNFIKKYRFDGLDVDWEFPAMNNGVPADKANFVTLLKELSAKLKPAGLLLTAAVSAYIPNIAIAYDVPNVNKYLDLVNLMTYDYHGSWDSVTGIVAPLYAATTDADKTLNVNASVVQWLKSGVPASKLVVGMPLYGCTFTLQDTTKTGLNAPITGLGTEGPYTKVKGTLNYNEICKLLKAGGWTVVMHPEQKVPYAYKNQQWIGYENVASIVTKANYVKQNNLAGSMVWALQGDDFYDECGTGAYPLTKAIKNNQG